MHLMPCRHVFNSSWSLSVIDMPQLFARLQLDGREVNLHLQFGLLGPCRRLVRPVRGRKVQGVNGISRMQRMFSRRVFNRWRGIDMHPLFL